VCLCLCVGWMGVCVCLCVGWMGVCVFVSLCGMDECVCVCVFVCVCVCFQHLNFEHTSNGFHENDKKITSVRNRKRADNPTVTDNNDLQTHEFVMAEQQLCSLF
jgi:hypothetical protein